MKDHRGYWKYGKEMLPIPEIIERYKGPREVLPYSIPKRPKNTPSKQEVRDDAQ